MADVHPKLQNFNFVELLVGDDEKAISFLQELKLIPSRDTILPQCCGIRIENTTGTNFGWRWRCFSKGSRKKGSKACRNTVNPCSGTFFDGSHCRIAIREAFSIILCFVMDVNVTQVFYHLRASRKNHAEAALSMRLP